MQTATTRTARTTDFPTTADGRPACATCDGEGQRDVPLDGHMNTAVRWGTESCPDCNATLVATCVSCDNPADFYAKSRRMAGLGVVVEIDPCCTWCYREAREAGEFIVRLRT